MNAPTKVLSKHCKWAKHRQGSGTGGNELSYNKGKKKPFSATTVKQWQSVAAKIDVGN